MLELLGLSGRVLIDDINKESVRNVGGYLCKGVKVLGWGEICFTFILAVLVIV